MLNPLEERREHRHDLEFSPNPLARPAVTKVFQGKRFVSFTVAGDWVRSPRWEPSTQLPVGFRQTPAGECKNANTRQIVQTGQRILFGALAIEGRALLAPADGIQRTLALLDRDVTRSRSYSSSRSEIGARQCLTSASSSSATRRMSGSRSKYSSRNRSSTVRSGLPKDRFQLVLDRFRGRGVKVEPPSRPVRVFPNVFPDLAFAVILNKLNAEGLFLLSAYVHLSVKAVGITRLVQNICFRFSQSWHGDGLSPASIVPNLPPTLVCCGSVAGGSGCNRWNIGASEQRSSPLSTPNDNVPIIQGLSWQAGQAETAESELRTSGA
jgi:hypothetical protein